MYYHLEVDEPWRFAHSHQHLNRVDKGQPEHHAQLRHGPSIQRQCGQRLRSCESSLRPITQLATPSLGAVLPRIKPIRTRSALCRRIWTATQVWATGPAPTRSLEALWWTLISQHADLNSSPTPSIERQCMYSMYVRVYILLYLCYVALLFHLQHIISSISADF